MFLFEVCKHMAKVSKKIEEHLQQTHGVKQNDDIVLQGVKTHNLKNIDITIPKNKLITVT